MFSFHWISDLAVSGAPLLDGFEGKPEENDPVLGVVAFGQLRLAGALLLGRSPLDSQKQLTLNTLRTAPNNPQPWFQACNTINPTPKGFCNADFGTVVSCDGGKRM